MCQTLFKNCSSAPTQCEPPVCGAKQDLSLAGLGLEVFEPKYEVDLNTLDRQLLPPVAECEDEILHYASEAGVPSERCPHHQFFGSTTRPWVEPQPESIPCPPCIATFASPGTLFFEVGANWKGELTSGTLKCGNSTFALGLPALQAHDKAMTHEIPESCLTRLPTLLSFTVAGDKATVIPLALCQHCTENP